MPNSAELSQKKDMSKFTKRKRFVDAKPPRDEGLQLETHVDSFTLQVDYSLDEVILYFLADDIIDKAWNGLNENLERDWVMIDGHDELASLKSRNLQSQKPIKKRGTKLTRFLESRRVRKQWPPSYQIDDLDLSSSTEDIKLSPYFILSTTPSYPNYFFLIEWFSKDESLTHVIHASPVSPTQTNVTVWYEFFLSKEGGADGELDEQEQFQLHRKKVASLWWKRFLDLFGGLDLSRAAFDFDLDCVGNPNQDWKGRRNSYEDSASFGMLFIP